MNKTTLGFSLVALGLLGSGVASAGYNGSTPVSLTSTTAQGTVPGARNSVDTVQQIFCVTYAYSSGSETGSCFAKNSAGTTKQCFAANPQQLAVMRSVSAASWIYFSIASDGSTCSQVSISSGSDSYK